MPNANELWLITWQWSDLFVDWEPPPPFSVLDLGNVSHNPVCNISITLWLHWAKRNWNVQTKFCQILHSVNCKLEQWQDSQTDLDLVWYSSCSEAGKISILVPGAGLGRLAYELARLGYVCQGNEFSMFMLLGSNFILNQWAKWIMTQYYILVVVVHILTIEFNLVLYLLLWSFSHSSLRIDGAYMHTICPWAHQFSNNLSYDHQVL